MNPTFRDIRAVTFDVGGTLIEPWPSVGHVYSEVASRFGITGVEPDALNSGFVRAWKARQDFDYSRKAWRRLVEQTFEDLTPVLPDEVCFNAIYDRFACAEAWRVFDDTRQALSTVKASGRKVGLISNWDERLRPLLNELQLTSHFAVIAVSCEVGCTKPKIEIFHHCAAQLGLPPASILHIGDSASEDVAGARAAGMQAVLLERKAGRAEDGAITNLDATIELLAGSPTRGVSD